MPSAAEPVETILIVDDEEPVRKTFREWLQGANLGCTILAAADAESALLLANQQALDLAILDWNLGAGNDGLQLLEDLAVFHPDIVAIMVTGYAHQATPLDAMRMGVRDYLDKNQDLNRETFLKAVCRQLVRIRPARRERQLHQSLAAFRGAVEKVLPLVQAAAALHDPVPLPAAIAALFSFLLRTTGARDGVLFIRNYEAERMPAEICRVYDLQGAVLAVTLLPFARSLAASVVSQQSVCSMNNLKQISGLSDLQPFEQGRTSLLAAPLNVGAEYQVVLELFDKGGDGFTEADRHLAAAAADFGAEMLRQALAERQTQRVLFDAVEAALGVSDSVAESLRQGLENRADAPPPDAVLQQLRAGFRSTPEAAFDANETVQLAEAVRVLAVKHGPAAVKHCIQLVESLRALLDNVTGSTEAGS